MLEIGPEAGPWRFIWDMAGIPTCRGTVTDRVHIAES